MQANDRLIAQSKDFPPWLYDDVKCLMGMSNVLWGCKICLKAIRNASMTDQTVKAGTQRSDASVVVCSSVCLPLLKHPVLCTFLRCPVLSCNILYYSVISCTILYYPPAYLIFVIFFTRAKFLENKIYTEKRQFFALNL